MIGKIILDPKMTKDRPRDKKKGRVIDLHDKAHGKKVLIYVTHTHNYTI